MEGMAHEFHEEETNNTVQEISYNFAHMQPYWALICVAGIITNAALLYILTKTNLCKTSNGLILNLTLSNLLFVLFYLPVTIAAIGFKSYPFSETVCKATDFINSLCFFVSSFTLISLCFLCILETPAPSGVSERIVAISAIWIAGFVLSLPSMFLAIKSEHEGNLLCPTYNQTYLELKVFVDASTIAAVPVAALVCYVKQNRVRDIQKREQNEVSNLVLVLVLVAVYSVCQVPGAIFDILILFFWFMYDDFFHGLDITTWFLNYVYPAWCAVALFCASGSFRQLFKRHLSFCCKKENQEPVAGSELGLQSLVQPKPSI